MTTIEALVIGAATIVWSLVITFAVMAVFEKFRIGTPPSDQEHPE